MLIDLPSRQDFDTLQAKLDAVLGLLSKPALPAADELLTLEEVATYTKFDRRTVRQWPTQGRYNQQGKKVYLPAYQFNGLLRFKRADVDAFGLGTGLLQPGITGAPEATKAAPATKATKKKGPPVPSAQALRVA